MQLMPKVILKILKVLALKTMYFSHKEIDFFSCSHGKMCSVHYVLLKAEVKTLFKLDFFPRMSLVQ